MPVRHDDAVGETVDHLPKLDGRGSRPRVVHLAQRSLAR